MYVHWCKGCRLLWKLNKSLSVNLWKLEKMKMRTASLRAITIPLPIPLQPSYYSCPLWSFIAPQYSWPMSGGILCADFGPEGLCLYWSLLVGWACDASGQLLLVLFYCWSASLSAHLYITRPPEKGKSFFLHETTESIKTSLHFFRRNESWRAVSDSKIQMKH